MNLSPIAIAKLALTVAGILVFMLGIRSGIPLLRWTGIGLVVAAWLLRFLGPRPPASAPRTSPPDSEDA